MIEAMQRFASFSDSAKEALSDKDRVKLADLMDANFANRRALYGDDVIGAKNLEIVDIVKQLGHAIKFSGSG